MHGNRDQRQFRGRLRTAGRDAGQWFPVGHGEQHSQRADQAAEYFTDNRE